MSTLIDSRLYLLTCVRYFELHAVTARNMVSHRSQYP